MTSTLQEAMEYIRASGGCVLQVYSSSINRTVFAAVCQALSVANPTLLSLLFPGNNLTLCQELLCNSHSLLCVCVCVCVQLKEMFPGFRLSLPPKRWFKDNYDSDFLEDRQLGLQAFMQNLVAHKDIANWYVTFICCVFYVKIQLFSPFM